MDNNAINFRDAWNRLFLFHNIDVCSDKLKGCGILELRILKLVYHNPSYKIRDILCILGIPSSTMTNTINRLTSKGLLQRKINNNDLRSFELELTDKGKDAVVEHLEAESKIFEKMLSPLENDEKEVFIKLFQKIVSKME